MLPPSVRENTIPGGSVHLDHNIYSLKQVSQVNNVNILTVSSEKYVQIMDNTETLLIA